MDSVTTIDLSQEELQAELERFNSLNSSEDIDYDALLEVEEEGEVEEERSEEEEIETLPKNSPTILLGEETSRFSSAEWFNVIKQMNITIAGLGGIGSWVAFLTGRMHPNSITLYDGDIVEQANMSGQLYSREHIGMSKANAISNIMREYSDYYYEASNGMLDSNSVISPVLLCGFDNMSARRLAFDRWKYYVCRAQKDKLGQFLLLDGRLAAEELQVFCMTGEDTYLMRKYEEEWLFSDEDAEQTVCSYKQTSYCANMIGSIMVNLLVNFAANQANPLVSRELPFMTRYDAITMMFKTE